VPTGRVKALLSLGVNYYAISDPASFAQQVLAALFDVLADHETERLMDEDAIWAQEQLAPTTSPTPAPNVNDTANPTTFAPTSSPTYNHASAIQYIGVAPGRGDTVLSLYCLPPHADHTCALVETYDTRAHWPAASGAQSCIATSRASPSAPASATRK